MDVRPLLRFDVAIERGRRVSRSRSAAAVEALASELAALPDAVVVVDGASHTPGGAFALGVAVRRVHVRASIARDSLAARLCDAAGDCTELTTASAPDAWAADVATRARSWLRVPKSVGGDVPALATQAAGQLARREGTEIGALAAANPALARDPRMSLLIAMAPCMRSRVDAECLRGLPAPHASHPAVLGALVDETEPGSDAQVVALVAWARAAASPHSAEVARDAAVGAGRFDDALAMDDLVRARGGEAASRTLRRALDVATGREPVPPPRPSAASSARAALDAGETRSALALADRALAEQPWHAEAWAIKARSLAELGRMSEAQAALVALEQVDPLSVEVTMVRSLLGGGTP